MPNISADRLRRFRLRTAYRNRIKRTSRTSPGAIYRMVCISVFGHSEDLLRLSSWKVGRRSIYFLPPTHNTNMTVCGRRQIRCETARRYGPFWECRNYEADLV